MVLFSPEGPSCGRQDLGAGVALVLIGVALSLFWWARQPARSSDRPVTYFSQEQLEVKLGAPAPPQQEYRMLGAEPSYQYMVVIRTEPNRASLNSMPTGTIS